MREIGLKLEHIAPKTMIEHFKERENINGEVGWRQGVKGDVVIEEKPLAQTCEKHECRLMFDDMNEFYYCPLCEK